MFMLIRKVIACLFFLSFSLFAAKLPELTPQDVVETLHAMMEAHVSCKEFSPALIKRTLIHYLEELDPTKTYLLKSEIAPWIEPNEALVGEICFAMGKGEFSHFRQIHSLMAQAVFRRQALENQRTEVTIPDKVSLTEFKDMDWVKSEEELVERVLKIKSLQTAATTRLEQVSRAKALQRIDKHRLAREEEITTSNGIAQERFVLSLVLKACAASFDTHTVYFTPWEASQFMIQLQQRLFGIGVQLRDDVNGFTVVKVIEGGPASHTDLKAHDRIIAINDEPVVGLDIMDTVDLIRGEEGSTVTLTVLRPCGDLEEARSIEIIRGEVLIQEARIDSKTLPFGDGIIAHITLHGFYQDPLHSSASDLYEEIKKIQKDYLLRGIVLDLRQNAGGVLPQAVAVTGLFITKGIVCSIKDNHGSIEHLRDIDSRTAFDGPLIVLTSKASASASEIVAQTLQDYGRAIVVGDEHTYGKGTFQTFTLDSSDHGKVNPKGEFKVTRGKYYTVSGKSPQLVGVAPDIIVPGIYSIAEIGERHAENPLENDSISENFNDDLSDVPPLQRDQISWLYRFNLQPKLKTYTRHLATLQKNSKGRIEQEYLYQSFLEKLKQEDIPQEQAELFVKIDPQLHETINIMKDLILLIN
jgi:carboxyl-terminal processing protease